MSGDPPADAPADASGDPPADPPADASGDPPADRPVDASADPPGRDPGLQAERTALAWQRTGVSGAALAGTTIVAAAHRSGPVVLALVAVLAGLCAVAVTVAVTVARRPRGEDSPWSRLVAVAALPVLLGVAGAALALGPA